VTVTPKKRVLVVDDDDTFRNGLKYALMQSGYDPILTVGGKVAQQLLEKGGIDVVLSDVNMPDGNGIELLKFIRQSGTVPIVMMTGLKSLIENVDVFRAGGILHFLPKPFSRETLVAALEAALAPPEVGPKLPPVEEVAYCKVPINDFISGKEVKYDLYVQLSDAKYVKIAHAGAGLPPEQIENYRERGVSHLYMTKGDFKDYLRFSVKISGVLKDSGTIPRQRKLAFLSQTSQLLMATMGSDQVNAEMMEQSRGIVESAVSVLSDSDAYFGLMDLMNTRRGGDNLYAHSLAVSLYSCLMANKLGWQSPNTLMYVATGSLFHDIGKKELPEDILRKPRMMQSNEERSIFESHSLRGAQILRAVPDTPDEVIWIVQQHHENEAGYGYPFRLRKGKIYPLAKLVAVADEFVDAVTREEKLDQEVVLRVLHQMVKFSKDLLDPGMMAALMSVFKFEIPADIRGAITLAFERKNGA
jgi:putative nucleotidyltransferase with HDIG domain